MFSSSQNQRKEKGNVQYTRERWICKIDFSNVKSGDTHSKRHAAWKSINKLWKVKIILEFYIVFTVHFSVYKQNNHQCTFY
jgi:hypothetical protein